ncbi:helix-turn-helix domain-containing protein [Candidatus Parabeggiatoa sp. HSG14]|uniref:helix-turn-helix domain-containing protein n=1 Tax=Candidatus Parabeggiatoa sp. HSG14 TaxID=3055593 RepID=UPI0025A84F27|nr:helix-turn-helix domain-containing protein [Thiotrichales bacterium HSG14]
MNNNSMPSFGQLLAKHMNNKNLNCNSLSRKNGVSRVTVSRWLNEDNMPRCENVEDTAKALKLPKDEIDELLLSAGCQPHNRLSFDSSPLFETKKRLGQKVPKKPELLPIPGIPIFHPCQFFGRSAMLKRIRRAWQQSLALQHVAVIGDRRSGKTSLLKYLQSVTQVPLKDLCSGQPQGWGNWQPKDFQFAFVDFQLPVMCQPESLLIHILKQLNLEIPTPCDPMNFSIVLDEQLDKPTIILMDEIGAGLRSPDLDATFWGNMRAFGNNCADGQLGFVVSAHEPLHKLAKESNKDSPFFNIFGQSIRFEAFTEGEARNLIDSFSLSLTIENTEWMLQKSGCWPALLQLLCDERQYALSEGDTSDNWKDEGLERIEPFLYLLES